MSNTQNESPQEKPSKKIQVSLSIPQETYFLIEKERREKDISFSKCASFHLESGLSMSNSTKSSNN